MKAIIRIGSLMLLLIMLGGCHNETTLNSFSLQGIEISQITQIDVTYSCDEYNKTIQIPKQSDLFTRIMAYLDCSLGEPLNKNISMFQYPIYVMVHESGKKTRMDFAASESGGKTDLYLIYKDKMYHMNNETAAALHVDETTVPHDPLAYTIFVYSGFQGEKRGVTVITQGDTSIPEVKTFVEYPDLLSEEEVENNTTIKLKGTLVSMETRKKDQLPANYMQIIEQANYPTGVYTIGQFTIDKIEKGENLITSDTIRILLPFANFDPGNQNEQTYGLTQQKIETGEQYILLLNRISVKDSSDLFVLSDFYQGIYKIKEGKRILLYNCFRD